MEIIRCPLQMQQWSLAERRQGRTIAFVPTMGYLHEGHLSLLRAGRQRADRLVLSIFVNPTQFGAGEDFDSYPRDLDRDSTLAQPTGVDILFSPSAAQMYPPGFATQVHLSGLTEGLCGASRSGHFDGVTTVVSKLFGIVQPQLALFGQKDFQQLAVIRQMTSDLNLPIEIVGMPIVRESDGLAMSSRNSYLTAELRQQGLSLSDALRQASAAARQGQRDAAVLLDLVRHRIGQEPAARIDYCEICQAQTLQPVSQVDGQSVLLLAVYFGTTRLIDNHLLLQPFPA